MRPAFLLLPNGGACAHAQLQPPLLVCAHTELCCSVQTLTPSGQCEKFLNLVFLLHKCCRMRVWRRLLPNQGMVCPRRRADSLELYGKDPQNGSNQSTFLKFTLKYCCYFSKKGQFHMCTFKKRISRNLSG